MTTIVKQYETERTSGADTVLKVAARLWLTVAVVGQWAFFYYIVAFYFSPTLRGNFQAWSRNTNLFKGYIAGDTAGNLAFAAHVLLAAIIAFGGALQLIPQLRARAMWFHRWNGRLFLITALAVSVTGVYMIWIRGSRSDVYNGMALTLDAALIILFGGLAWRSAVKREISKHRRWAMRTYLAANAQWFIRVGVSAWIVINQGNRGLDTFFSIWSFGSYLVPLAVLELYLHAKEGGGRRWRLTIASVLFVLTALMGVGIVALFMIAWKPLV